MTNYNERLDEILHDIIHIGYVQGFNQIAHAARFAPYNHIEPITIEEAKQALTSLIKELVVEAKPKKHNTDVGDAYQRTFCGEYNKGIDQFEQNLLKALEDKK